MAYKFLWQRQRWMMVTGVVALAAVADCGGRATLQNASGDNGAGPASSSVGVGGGGASGGGGGASTATSGAGGGGGDGGDIGTDCNTLLQQYAATLIGAKQCAGTGDPLQCDQLVDNSLVCSCPTSINSNTAAASLLGVLQQKWIAAGCNIDVNCPPFTCVDIQGTGCVDGTCTDFGPD